MATSTEGRIDGRNPAFSAGCGGAGYAGDSGGSGKTLDLTGATFSLDAISRQALREADVSQFYRKTSVSIANPDNFYHFVYQRRCDRMLIAVLAAMALYAHLVVSWNPVQMSALAYLILVLFLHGLAVMVTVFAVGILSMLWDIFNAFLDWVWGH